MSILDKLRGTPEERERKAAEKGALAAAQQAERDEAERLKQLEVAKADLFRREAYLRSCLGDELYEMSNVDTVADAKIAIKLARLRKKELQGEKRDLAAELADERERWRERQAGRISTVGLGRGTGGRVMRGMVQGQRRSERQDHAGTVNQFSDARQEIDRMIAVVDRFIIDCERQVAKG